MSKGDKDRTADREAFDKNYERIFGKNQKVKQLQVTDLNWDGDLGLEGDTRIPEDYYKNIEVVTLPKKHLISRMMEKLNKEYPATLKSLKDKS
jgi:hypothetical protein